MRYGSALVAALFFAGCGGGPSSSTPALVITHELFADTTTPLTAPLAIGASATIAVTEQTCRLMSRPNGPPVGNDCGAIYVPALVRAVVLPMDNTGKPCPLSAQVMGPGTVTVTRTGSGDPVRAGRCSVSIQDPQTNAGAVIVDV